MDVSPWFVLALGMGTVFIGLIVIILLVKLMSALLKTENTAAASAAESNITAPACVPAQPAISQPKMPIADRACLSAVIAAAIASYTGTNAEGLRICRMKALAPAPESADAHNRFVAAIAAAIATETGTDASGLRIRSIRKI